jgi:hypothetical protein
MMQFRWGIAVPTSRLNNNGGNSLATGLTSSWGSPTSALFVIREGDRLLVRKRTNYCFLSGKWTDCSPTVV